MVKLFKLDWKYDGPLAVAYEIRAIMHDIDATAMKREIPHTTFTKAHYLTYSHYLESLQASDQLKSIIFDSGG